MIGNIVSNDYSACSPTSLAGDHGSGGYSGFGVPDLPSGDVPEPATLALLGLGLCTLAVRRTGRRSRHH